MSDVWGDGEVVDSPPTLERAVTGADPLVLVCALAHITRDRSWLTRYPVDHFDHGWRFGAPTADERADLDGRAVETLAWVSEHGLDTAPLDDDLLFEIMRFCAGESVSRDYVPLARDECNFDGGDARRPAWSITPDAATLERFPVGIIGAGFGGLCAAIRLQQLGIPYTIYEKNDAVGGTWYENSFPDLRVDVPNHFYSYSFVPNPDWTSFFAERDELRRYIDTIVEEYGLAVNIRLGTEVLAATYDEARGAWRLRLRTTGADGTLVDGDAEVRALISAVGMLNRPSVPDLEGLDDFGGRWFHSTHWDHDLDLHGRRVGVVGTGASSMQIVPAVAPAVEHLTIFQRGRHWALPNPRYHRKVGAEEGWLFRNVPFYGAWYRFLLMWTVADRNAAAFTRDPEWEATHPLSISPANDKRRALMTTYIESELEGYPELVAKAVPDYPAMGKRILQDNGWYRTLRRDNVELTEAPIRRVTPAGVLTADGREHPLDVLVLATGFHPNKFLWPMEIRGRERTLHEVWGEDPRAYLGITMPGFPNLFCLYGPNTNPLVGSVIFMLECQVDYVVQCLMAMVEADLVSMECRADVHDEYNERVDAAHEGLVWRHPKVHSYYNNKEGRVTTNSPWRLVDYWRMTKHPDLADFEVRAKEHV